MMKFTSINLFGRGGKKIVRPLDRTTKEHTMNTITRLMTKSQAGTIAWLNDCIERSQHGIVTETIDVSPGLAAEILRRNDGNRCVKPVKAGHYAADMLNGDWQMNGENIIIAKTGELNDGQHRLQAVIDANVVVTFPFLFGVERSSRLTVDQGAARTAGDYLTMDGVHNGSLAAATARLVKAYESSRGRNIAGAKDYTNAMIIARVKADDDIQAAAKFTTNVSRYARGLINPAIIGACYYILSEVNAADAEEYMLAVVVGENIARGHPAFAVRTSLTNMEHVNKAARMEAIFRGWNAFRQDRKLHLAKVMGSFPALV